MTPRPDVSEQRKRQILAAAMQVFARLGFHKARMDDVAREAGVSKGLLYWYYKNKDALIAAILDHIFAWELRHLEVVHQMPGRATERLHELTRRVVAEVERISFLFPMAFEFYALAGRRPEVRAALQRYYDRYYTLLTDILRDGVQRGEFRADIRPEDAATSIVALFEGMVLLYMLNPEEMDFARTCTEGMTYLLTGLVMSETERGSESQGEGE